MKKYLYILVFGLMLSACTNSSDTGITISVLEDVTEDDFIARPQPNAVVSSFNFDSNLWQSAEFRYGSITSLIHNKHDACSITGENSLMGNEIERKGLVVDFKKDVRRILEQPKDFSKGQYSSIWEPIVRELEVLQKNMQNHSTLYVFSDLQENNATWFSVHRYKDLKVIKTTPNKVKDQFLKHATSIVCDNPNIKVIVVYQPKDMKQDASFSMLTALYTSVFDELGIDISFTAQL